MTEINWSDLVDNAGDVSFEALPENDYDMVVKECDFKRTAEKNKKMYVLKASVESGAHKNRVVWDNLVVSPENPNALSIFFRKMAALGIPSDFFKTNPTDDAVCQAVTGRRFRAHVNQRTWQGNKKNGIASYFPPSSAGIPPSVQAPAAAAPPPPAAAPAPAAPVYQAPEAPAAAAPPQPPPTAAPAQPQFTPEPAPVSPPPPAQPVQDPWSQPAPAAQFPTEQPAPAAQAAPPPEAATPPPPPPPPPAQATQEQQAPAAPAAAPASPF